MSMPDMSMSMSMPECQGIVDIAVGNPDFSTLVAAVTAAGLVDALSGDGPLTVFGTYCVVTSEYIFYIPMYIISYVLTMLYLCSMTQPQPTTPLRPSLKELLRLFSCLRISGSLQTSLHTMWLLPRLQVLLCLTEMLLRSMEKQFLLPYQMMV